MSGANTLHKAISLAEFAVQHPKLALNLLAQAPSYIRGLQYAARYDDGRHRHSPRGDAATPEWNKLRDFFNARTSGRGIWKWMHYFDIYERHLRKFVEREVHIVEIGVYSGGSLDMWKDYFGTRCHIYGVDIEQACKVYESDHVKIHIGDQADWNFWREFKEQVPTIDILIDDGGHGAEQQIVPLEEMLPHLRPGGVYMCEDVHGVHNGFSSFTQALVNCLNSMEMADENLRHKGGIKAQPYQACVGSMHFYPFLTVLEKAGAPTRKLTSQRHGTEWQPFRLA